MHHQNIAFSAEKIEKLWSEEQFSQLCRHLHGQDQVKAFGHAYIHHKNLELLFRGNKRGWFLNCVASSWASIVGKSSLPYAVMVGPSAQKDKCPTFFVFDLDAHACAGMGFSPTPHHHEPPFKRDVLVFEREAAKLRDQGIFYLTEDSGRGWHLWLISLSPRSIREWQRLTAIIKTAAGFSSPFEEYPISLGGNKKGKSGEAKLIRVPGSSNPSTFNPARGDWCDGIIHGSNLDDEFWARLPPFTKEKSISLFNEGFDDLEHEEDNDHKLIPALLKKHQIDSPATRHNRTVALLGEGIHQFARGTLLALASRLYAEALSPPGTPLTDHLEDAKTNIEYVLQKNVLPRFSRRELEAYRQQRRESSQAAFVILHNFAQLNPAAFPISGPDLARRLMITTPSAYEIIRRFERDKIIECVDRSWQRGLRAKKFRWLLRSE